MNIISIDDLFKKGELSQLYFKYANRLFEGCNPNDLPILRQRVIHKCGFFKWDDIPECWASSWGKEKQQYVLINIYDVKHHELKTIEELKVSYKNYSEHSIFNFPHRFHDKFNRMIQTNDAKLCQRCSVTQDEYDIILEEMTDSEFKKWTKDKNKCYRNLVSEIPSIPTFENPYSISLHGTDDTSYGLTFRTLDDAYKTANNLIENPTWDNLKELKFVFTN